MTKHTFKQIIIAILNESNVYKIVYIIVLVVIKMVNQKIRITEIYEKNLPFLMRFYNVSSGELVRNVREGLYTKKGQIYY